MVWYSYLFQNFPQFLVIHTVKGFGIVNKAEIDVFLELSCIFDDLADAGNLIAGSLAVIHQQYTGSYWCSRRGRGSEVLCGLQFKSQSEAHREPMFEALAFTKVPVLSPVVGIFPPCRLLHSWAVAFPIYFLET